MWSAILVSGLLAAGPLMESPSISRPTIVTVHHESNRETYIPLPSPRPNPSALPQPEMLMLKSPDGEGDVLFVRGIPIPPTWIHGPVMGFVGPMIGLPPLDLLASEGPANAPPPPPSPRLSPDPTGPECLKFEPKLEKSAYMGLFTAPVSDTIREQLDIPRGTGLIVEVLDPDGPAKIGGLQQHDILTKFDDQLLVNSEQLAVLVHTKAPGTSVELSVLRKTKELKVTVKLGEKMLPKLDPQAFFNHEFPGDVTPPGLPGQFPPGRAPFQGAVSIPRSLLSGRRVNVVIEEADHRLTFSPKDGHESLRVDDNAGKTLFEGPIETPEDREKLPPEYKKWLATYDKIAHPKPGESVNLATTRPASQPAR